jgi:hypothetical protein
MPRAGFGPHGTPGLDVAISAPKESQSDRLSPSISCRIPLWQFDQYYLPIDLHQCAWTAMALFVSSIPKRVDGSLEGVIVPMCQSPKIADAFLRMQKLPANDNCLSAETAKRRIEAGTRNLVRATCQTLLVFCCAVAILLL